MLIEQAFIGNFRQLKPPFVQLLCLLCRTFENTPHKKVLLAYHKNSYLWRRRVRWARIDRKLRADRVRKKQEIAPVSSSRLCAEVPPRREYGSPHLLFKKRSNQSKRDNIHDLHSPCPSRAKHTSQFFVTLSMKICKNFYNSLVQLALNAVSNFTNHWRWEHTL